MTINRTSSKRKIQYGIGIILILLLAFGFNYGLKYAYIGSSYDAKMVCSCMFISGRGLDSIKTEDLYTVPYANIEVDKELQTVTADIYGLAKTKAIFRKGLGCTLVNEISEEELRNQPNVPSADTINEQLQSATETPYNIDKTLLTKAVDAVFMEKEVKNVMRTRAVVVLYKGQIIAEKYAKNITPQTKIFNQLTSQIKSVPKN